jgi:acetyl-CoA acetyltransferase
MVKLLEGERSLRGASAVVGVGLSRFGDLAGRTHMEIMGEAVHHALVDAGLGIHDVDGIFASNFVDQLTPLVVAEYFGIKPDFMDGSNLGGSVFVNSLLSATLALKHGLCNVALICYGSNSRSGGVVAPAHAKACTSRVTRCRLTRSPPRGICTSTARRQNSSPKSRSPRASGPS